MVRQPSVNLSPVWLVMAEVLEQRAVSDLLDKVVSAQDRFRSSTTASGSPDHRKSLVLERAWVQDEAAMLEERVRAHRAAIENKFPHVRVSDSHLWLEVTAHGDGCYYRPHIDVGSPRFPGRQLSVVYYFFHHPNRFTGGELVLWDTVIRGPRIEMPGGYSIIEPQLNSCIIFDSRIRHEVRPVLAPSQRFSDGRFTINGWLSRRAGLAD